MSKRTPKIEIYKDAKGEWRWRLLVNGRITADSGEGYKRKSGVHKAISRLKDLVTNAVVWRDKE